MHFPSFANNKDTDKTEYMTAKKDLPGKTMQVFLMLRAMLYIFNNYFIDIYFGNDKIMTEKISGPDACGMYCNVMERKVMKKSTGKKGNGGFSLVELIIVIAIMAVLVGVLAPQYLSYIHKAKVAADQANLKNYFTEIQLDYASTGVYNPQVPLVDKYWSRRL